MILNKNLKICVIEESKSLKELLVSMGFSKSQLNKYLSKKNLNTSIKEKQEIELPIDLLNIGMISPFFEGDDLEMIYEDANFMAIHKPHNINGHSLNYSDTSCLSALRKAGRFDLLQVNPTEHERGMLYRLDSVTSGVLVFAKSDEIYQKVRESFTSVAKEKVYWAIVKGEVSLEGSYTHFFKAKGEKGSRMQVFDEADSETKVGTLHILECQNRGNYTRLTIRLISGLRHQIRSQLAHLGHPIIGDTFYGGEVASRVYLHAFLYKFVWGNDEIEFVDPNFNWPE